MLRALGIFLFLGISWSVRSQGGPYGTAYYPEKLRADTEVLRALVHEAHPDPYRYVTKEELDAAFDRVVDSITVPLTAGQYLERLMPLFRSIGDSHCYPELGIAAQEHLRHDAALIPLKVRFLVDGIHVLEELKGYRSLPPGARILAINALPMATIIERMEDLVVADGANRTLGRYLVERDFSVLLNRVACDTSMFRLNLQVDGVEEERTIFAMTGDEIARSRKPAGAALMPWRAEWEPESGSVWVTLGTLEADSLERAGQNSGRFLAAMLQELEQNKAHTLVLDLRGSAGKDPAMAEIVFATVAQEPFRAVQRITARSAAPPHYYELAAPNPEYYASVGRNYVIDPLGAMDGRPSDERFELKSPMDAAFAGRVFVVCDGATRDAAALLVMLAKRTGRARILGEEIGSNALSFTDGGELLVTTPNAGVRVHVPLVRLFPSGQPTGATDHGELPDHALEQRSWGIAKGRDTVKETVLRMLRELQ
ncbi:MAG: S41 family peptidase [Flavobacteriales bacterium]